MKSCPVCQTSYDNETLRFCTKDGATLIVAPSATPIPVEPIVDDEDESTQVLSKNATPQSGEFFRGDETLKIAPVTPNFTAAPNPSSSKFVVSLEDDKPENWKTSYVPPAPPMFEPKQNQPRKSSVVPAVLLTLFGGGFLLLAAAVVGVAGYFYMSRNPNSQIASANTNANVANSASNTNSPFDVPLPNLNLNANMGAANVNSTRTPTPKPTQTATPKPSPTVTQTPNSANSGTASNANLATRTPSRNPTEEDDAPTPPSRPTQSPLIVGKTTPTPSTGNSGPISGGVVNGKARNLVKPAYPPAAKAVRASGPVNVQVLIDESGRVASASAVSGHPLLRQAAENAARQSTFSPTILSGQAVKVSGIIVYNFVP